MPPRACSPSAAASAPFSTGAAGKVKVVTWTLAGTAGYIAVAATGVDTNVGTKEIYFVVTATKNGVVTWSCNSTRGSNGIPAKYLPGSCK